MRKKIYLPRSAHELKKPSHQKQAELWGRYHNSPYERQFRALWYFIACENANLKIERKHLTKLEKYAENPDECMVKVYKTKYNLHPGTEIIKTYLGRQYKVTKAEVMILFTTDSISKPYRHSQRNLRHKGLRL